MIFGQRTSTSDFNLKKNGSIHNKKSIVTGVAGSWPSWLGNEDLRTKVFRKTWQVFVYTSKFHMWQVFLVIKKLARQLFSKCICHRKFGQNLSYTRAKKKLSQKLVVSLYEQSKEKTEKIKFSTSVLHFRTSLNGILLGNRLHRTRSSTFLWKTMTKSVPTSKWAPSCI